MAVVNILDAFTYKWAQTGTAEALTDDQWRAGWAFIGALPPSVEQFNKWGQVFDEKSNYLYSQMKAVFDAAGEVPSPADINSLRDALLAMVGGGRVLRTSRYRLNGAVQEVSIDGGAFTATGAGTFTALAATKSIYARVQAGGGGSGGVAATAAGQIAAGTGGTGGSYGEGLYTSGFSGGIPITVGAGGAGGAAGNNPGASGGASSVASLLTCPPGFGNAGGPANPLAGVSAVDVAPSAAPVGANLLAVRGEGGGFIFLTSGGQSIGSRGGASFSGPGPGMQNNGAGIAAVNPGAGGSGATQGPSLPAAAGAAGAAGYVIIVERA